LDFSFERLIELAARRGYDTRVGLEDSLVLPEGTRAGDNAELVAAARRSEGLSFPPSIR
jgi:uncharacterized protein (DUF849 family)